MRENTKISKASRFEARITKDQKTIFQRAAILGGHRSLTEFVIQSAQEKADALGRCYLLSEQIGSIAVVVDALHKKASSFYESDGFIKLSDGKRLFLPM